MWKVGQLIWQRWCDQTKWAFVRKLYSSFLMGCVKGGKSLILLKEKPIQIGLVVAEIQTIVENS